MHIKKFLSFFYKKDDNMPNWSKFLPKKIKTNQKKKKF